MTPPNEPGISRRTLAKGAAWAIPAATLAAAAPAYAASKPEIEIDWGNSSGCKIPGNSMKHCYDKGYVLWGVFENNTALAASVTITSMSVGGVPQCVAALVDYGSPSTTCTTTLAGFTFTVSAGATRYIAVFSNAATDSATNTVTVNFNYTLTGQQPKSSSQTSPGSEGTNPWSGDRGQGSCTRPNNCPAPPDLCTNPCGTGASTTTSTTAAPTTTTTTTAEVTTTTTTAEVTTTTTTAEVSTTTTTTI